MLIIENCNSLSDLRQKLIDGEEVRTARQEPCEDAIRREDAINAVSEALEHVLVENEDVARKMMNKLPSVNPQPKTGHWIDEGIYADGQNYHAFMCSECEWHYIGNKSELVDFKYCPFCRAKMQEAAEGSDKE